MTMPKSLIAKILIALIFVFGPILCFAQCKNIDAAAKVVKTPQDTNCNQSIIIEFKNGKKDLFSVSVFAPDRNNILNSDKTEFNNLSQGKYLIVIVGKREEDNYCPKSINTTIN